MKQFNHWVVERAGYLMREKNMRLHCAIDLAFEQYRKLFKQYFIAELKREREKGNQ